MDFEDYKTEISSDIRTILSAMAVQPILFVGSGASKRYFNGPSWEELLKKMAESCPTLDKEFAYYKQAHDSLIDVGSTVADAYREWAWSTGKKHFDKSLFDASQPSSAYLKSAVASHIASLLDPKSWKPKKSLKSEIDALINMRPHALITTNYDFLLEAIYPDYEPIIGQQILSANYTSIGEILKIHGCVSDPSSIVLTRDDYDEFTAKKKYLSAKLLTYFSEHPLVFVGYSATDPNIQAILSDIDEILSPNGELIENIYLVQRVSNTDGNVNFAREALIDVGSSTAVRVKKICSDDFSWIYSAFKSDDTLESVNPKLLRALMARTFKLVRHDIPTKTIEVDYEKLEHALASDGDFAKLYGITTLDDPSAVNAMYPYTLTQIGRALGYRSWHGANVLLNQIAEEKGVNLKESDNSYHVAFMAGTKSKLHKYSEAAIELLRIVDEGDEYELDILP